AEVAGVGDAGGDQEERRGAVLGGADEVDEGDRIERAGQRDDALGRVGTGLCVETGPGHGLDGDAALGGELLYVVELGGGVLVLGHEDAADAAAGGLRRRCGATTGSTARRWAHRCSMRTMAMQAIPSARPSAPMPSARVA